MTEETSPAEANTPSQPRRQIRKLRLKNYRNLRIEDGVTIDDLTLLVGPNGFGKTSFLRVLRFLRDAWVGSVEERRGVTHFEVATAHWGGPRILDATLPYPSVVEVAVEVFGATDAGFDGLELVEEIKVSNDRVTVHTEILNFFDYDGVGEASIYQTKNSEGRVVIYNHHNAVSVKAIPKNLLSPTELPVHTITSGLQRGDLSFDGYETLVEATILLQNLMREWAFYDASQMDLEAVRRAQPEIGLGDIDLSPSGENLPLVIFNLCKDIDFQERLVEAMRQLFPDTRTIRPTIIGRVSLSLEWYKHGIKRPFYLDEMSDGTVRMLCWATVLLSPIPPSLIVIDEPEASLHPAWLRVLAGWIRDAARRTQVIISTHSPDLLDYFTEDAASVRIFEPDKENPAYATVRKFDPATVADKLAEGWKLGDLYRVGDPELGGWPW